MTDPDVMVTPAVGLTDDETAAVLELLAKDDVTGPIYPIVQMLITSLAPMMGVTAEEADDAPGGVAPLLWALYRCVGQVVDRRDVRAYHEATGAKWDAPA